MSMYEEDVAAGKIILKVLGLGVGGIALLTGGIKSCETVEEGHRGIKVRFGEVVSSEPLQPGLHFKIPFLDDIYSMDVRTKLMTEETKPLTSDSQPATINFALNYNLQPDFVIPMYRTVGLDYEKVLIENVALNVIQKTIGQTKADELVNKKSETIGKIQTELTAELAKSGINVTTFSVPGLTFSPAFTESIERKEMARQASLQEGYNTARAKELADQKIEAARGEAESMKLVADAEAHAIQKRAEAASSNPQALEFEIISKWDGRLPMVTGGGSNILDVKSLLSDSIGRPMGPVKVKGATPAITPIQGNEPKTHE